MIKYVVGIMFSENWQHMLLIEKKRPEWQAGLLNGIGGKIEPGETSLQCMVREFKEEAGIETTPSIWYPAITLCGASWSVDFYYAVSDKLYRSLSMTDERVIPLTVANLPILRTINNLQWIIPMMRYLNTNPETIEAVDEEGEANG